MRTRRGWVILDILMAMMIVAILGSILGAAAEMHQRVRIHLDDAQAATRAAESALLKMQSHQNPLKNSINGNSGQLHFQKLPNSPQLSGMEWIEVRANVHNRTASIIGLVPQNAPGEK